MLITNSLKYNHNLILNAPKEIINEIVNYLPLISIYNLSRTCKMAQKIYNQYLNDLSDLNVRLILIIEALILPYGVNVIKELIDYWFDLEKLTNSLNWKFEINRMSNYFNLDPYICTCTTVDEKRNDNITQKLLKLKPSSNKPVHITEHTFKNKNIYFYFHQSKKQFTYNTIYESSNNNTTNYIYDAYDNYNTNIYYSSELYTPSYKKSTKCKTLNLRVILCTLYCQMKYVLLNDNVEKLIWYQNFTHYIPSIFQFNYAVLHKANNCAIYIFETYLLEDNVMLHFSTQSILGDYANYNLLEEMKRINRQRGENTIFTSFKFRLIFKLALHSKNQDVVKWILNNINVNIVCIDEEDYFTFIRSGYYFKYHDKLEQAIFLKFNKFCINTINFDLNKIHINHQTLTLNTKLINGFLINGNPQYAWIYLWKYGISINENTVVIILRLWNKYVTFKKKILNNYYEQNDNVKKRFFKKKILKLRKTEISLKNWRLYILTYPLAIYKTYKVLSFATLFKDFLFIKMIMNLFNYEDIKHLEQLEDLVFLETNDLSLSSSSSLKKKKNISNLLDKRFMKKHNQVWTDIKNEMLTKPIINNNENSTDNDDNNVKYLNDILDQDLKNNEYIKKFFDNLYNNKYCPSKMLFYNVASNENVINFNPCFKSNNGCDAANDDDTKCIDFRHFKITNSLVIADKNNEKYYNDYDGNMIADYGLDDLILLDNILLKLDVIERNLTTSIHDNNNGNNNNDNTLILQYELFNITGFAVLTMDVEYLKILINEPYNYPKTFFSYIACMFHTHVNNDYMNYLIVEQFPIIKNIFLKFAKYLYKPEWIHWINMNENRLNIVLD